MDVRDAKIIVRVRSGEFHADTAAADNNSTIRNAPIFMGAGSAVPDSDADRLATLRLASTHQAMPPDAASQTPTSRGSINRGYGEYNGVTTRRPAIQVRQVHWPNPGSIPAAAPFSFAERSLVLFGWPCIAMLSPFPVMALCHVLCSTGHRNIPASPPIAKQDNINGDQTTSEIKVAVTAANTMRKSMEIGG